MLPLMLLFLYRACTKTSQGQQCEVSSCRYRYIHFLKKKFTVQTEVKNDELEAKDTCPREFFNVSITNLYSAIS